jgi:hypothetical protein
MKLIALVSADVAVERRKGLSGPESTGHNMHADYRTSPNHPPDGYWYGPASPADGWTAIPTVPDPTRTASK